MTGFRRYVFVAGLQRTGSRLLAPLITQHPDVAEIVGSPEPVDEGYHQEGAIPHTAWQGVPGHYATDPAQHDIKGGHYEPHEVQARMETDREPWFAPGGGWRMRSISTP